MLNYDSVLEKMDSARLAREEALEAAIGELNDYLYFLTKNFDLKVEGMIMGVPFEVKQFFFNRNDLNTIQVLADYEAPDEEE